jgi:putative PIN family toxin of toxin-antitoxin system
MVSSRATRRELGELLLRPIIAAKLAITALEVDDFMAEIDEFTLLIDPVPRHFSFERDPKDLPFLNLAIEARATHLITRDRDLLDLRDPANAEWAKLAPDLAIVSPEEFLSAMI